MRGRRQRSGECDAAGRGQAHRERSPREWGLSGGASSVPARGPWGSEHERATRVSRGGDPHRAPRRSGESPSPGGPGTREAEEEPPTWNAPGPGRGRSRSVRWVTSSGFARTGSSQTPSQPGDLWLIMPGLRPVGEPMPHGVRSLLDPSVEGAGRLVVPDLRRWTDPPWKRGRLRNMRQGGPAEGATGRGGISPMPHTAGSRGMDRLRDEDSGGGPGTRKPVSV